MKKTDSIATLDLLADNLGEKEDPLFKIERGIRARKTSDLLAENKVGYVPALFIWCPLPYKNVGNKYERIYGDGKNRIQLQMTSLREIGVPYSKKGRQVLSLITSQAVLGKNKHIDLGDISEAWMKMNFKSSSGGQNGNIKRITETFQQFASLALSSSSKVIQEKYEGFVGNNILVADKIELYWNKPKEVGVKGLFENYIDLSERFFNLIVNHAVPIDIVEYNKLQSPRKQDIYAWLVRSMFKLKDERVIPWEKLYPQFSDNLDPRKKPEFRSDFKDALFIAKQIYPEANLRVDEKNVILEPSLAHIPHINPKNVGYI
ncbi:plasmid replication protein [Spirochaetia bacterium]|nr:plasmid replication protein [Spirochaetia bacterium]